jgi:hypothetical protein
VPPQLAGRETAPSVKEAEQQMPIVNRWMTELKGLYLS